MGGIRKKTSKRGTTFQASKIKKKAAETRKKNTRGKKKDVTWKSKKTKDPGIPNNFPFKDKVLAEIAEQKRAAEEDRLAKKVAAKAAAREPPQPDSDEEEGNINPGIMSLLNRTAVNARSLVGKAVSALTPGAQERESSPPPELVDNLLINTQAALDRADVVVEVVDARDPTSFRSAFLEEVVLAASPFDDDDAAGPSSAPGGGWKKDKLLILLNKTDLVPRESTTAWLLSLRQTFSSHVASGQVQILPFKASVTAEKPMEVGANGMRPGVPLGKEAVVDALRAWAGEKLEKGEQEEGLSVVFVGLPNVGKSAVINTLLGKPILATAPTQPTSGGTINTTTTSATEVLLPSASSSSSSIEISLIDTPGLEFNELDLSDSEGDDEDEAEVDDDMDEEDFQSKQEKWDILEKLAAKDMLARNMGRVDKIKDSYPLVKQIVGRANAQDLMMAYNIPAFKAGDLNAFLIELARANGRVKKHGVADVDSAARIVLRDWAFNTFPHYTMPSKADSVAKEVLPSAKEVEILSALPLKTQLRKIGKGLVRLQNGEVDARELILDEDYVEPEVPEEDDDEDADEDDFDGDGLESEDEDEEEPTMWDGEGEEVILADDVEPSESEDGDDEGGDEEESEEEEAAPTPLPIGNKRKRQSTGSIADVSTKKARSVMFASKPKGPAPKAEFATPKANPSSILKRKGRAEEESDVEMEVVAPRGKKAKGDVVQVVKVVKEVKEVQIVKAVPTKSAKDPKEPKAKKAKPNVKAAKPVVAAVSASKGSGGLNAKSKATENVPNGEKPYSFDAHFF